MVANEFSLQLRRFRAERHITQRDLSRLLSVSLSAIQKWEQGQRTPKKLTQDAITQELRRLT